MYREFGHPYERQAAECAHALSLPHALHICGNTSLILEDMVATGSDALELDYRTDMRKACEVMRGRCTFIGNLDPSGVLALGSETLVEEKTRELLDCFRDNSRLVLNAGCAIPPTTPSANIRALMRAVRA
jgi:uroporphyrinogen decarboxylase